MHVTVQFFQLVITEFETTMLKARVHLNKIDFFRDVLEEHKFALASSTHLRKTNYLLFGKQNEWKGEQMSGKESK